MPYQAQVRETGKVIDLRDGESLLDAATRQGVTAIHRGCRGGGCGVCKVRVLSGAYALGKCSVAVLPPDERGVGFVLSCKTFASTDLVVSTEAESQDR